MSSAAQPQEETLFGHPAGLFTLFFAEMWERFSYYGMRALLVFYMVKGFLGYGDGDAYTVYGAYTALVYMTPFFGGLLADRLLGARKAVIFGAILMALGEFCLMHPSSWAFYSGLALLIAGNGFFKPNISAIVGRLYPQGSVKRDGGFTIFYMGINLGAALSPLLCGYVGENYGWHYGFGLAALGMTTGLAVFWNWLPPGDVGTPKSADALSYRPGAISQAIIGVGAIAAAVALILFRPENLLSVVVNWVVAIVILFAAFVSCLSMRRSKGALINVEWAIYIGTILFAGIFMLLVSGFSPFTEDNRPVAVIPDRWINQLTTHETFQARIGGLSKSLASKNHSDIETFVKYLPESVEENKLTEEQAAVLTGIANSAIEGKWDAANQQIDEAKPRYPTQPLIGVLAVVLKESSRPAGLVLMLSGLAALIYLVIETVRLERIPRQRMYVVLILTFFSMLFWAFFEQAGSSLNNFTDRNVVRLFPSAVQQVVTNEEVGTTIDLQPTQEQLGFKDGDKMFTIDALNKLRDEHAKDHSFTIPWKVVESNVGMRIATWADEIPASTLQAANPIYILTFGLMFTALWGFLGARGWEPSTPLKFALGLLQLGLGFAAFWIGATLHDDRGMVNMSWLLLGYMFHTTGELCLSPVGLSMITRLSPARLVSTVMGAWFLATAFSQFLAAIIAQFTRVSSNGDASDKIIPPPIETVTVYGDVFQKIAIAAGISAVICLLLVPMLKYWMHQGVEEHE